jgi:hypothetical protein
MRLQESRLFSLKTTRPRKNTEQSSNTPKAVMDRREENCSVIFLKTMLENKIIEKQNQCKLRKGLLITCFFISGNSVVKGRYPLSLMLSEKLLPG